MFRLLGGGWRWVLEMGSVFWGLSWGWRIGGREEGWGEKRGRGRGVGFGWGEGRVWKTPRSGLWKSNGMGE